MRSYFVFLFFLQILMGQSLGAKDTQAQLYCKDVEISDSCGPLWQSGTDPLNYFICPQMIRPGYSSKLLAQQAFIGWACESPNSDKYLIDPSNTGKLGSDYLLNSFGRMFDAETAKLLQETSSINTSFDLNRLDGLLDEAKPKSRTQDRSWRVKFAEYLGCMERLWAHYKTLLKNSVYNGAKIDATSAQVIDDLHNGYLAKYRSKNGLQCYYFLEPKDNIEIGNPIINLKVYFSFKNRSGPERQRLHRVLWLGYGSNAPKSHKPLFQYLWARLSLLAANSAKALPTDHDLIKEAVLHGDQEGVTFLKSVEGATLNVTELHEMLKASDEYIKNLEINYAD